MGDECSALKEALAREGIDGVDVRPFVDNRGTNRFSITFKGDDSMCAWDFLMRALDNEKSRGDALALSADSEAKEAGHLSHPNALEPPIPSIKASIYERLTRNLKGNDQQYRSDVIWGETHAVNGVLKHSDKVCRDFLLGQRVPEPVWSSFLPTTEEWVTGPMHWLQELGIIDVDRLDADRWKREYWNQVPTTGWVNLKMQYQKGSQLIAPTKKCMYRLCVLAQATLFGYTDVSRKNFRDFDVSKIIARWGETICRQGIEYRDPDKHTETVYIGTEYRTLFGSDYSEDVLETNSTLQYECHYIPTRNVEDMPGLSPDDTDHLSLCRSYYEENEAMAKMMQQKEQFTKQESSKAMDGKPSVESSTPKKKPAALVELFEWAVHRDAQDQKILPQKCSRIVLKRTAEGEPTIDFSERLSVGPKRFLPCNPFVAVMMFWASLRRLLCDESEGFVLDDQNTDLKDTFELANFFLQLVSCTTSAQLWEIHKKAPGCYKENLPNIPVNCSREIRRFHHREALSIAKIKWHGQDDGRAILKPLIGSDVTLLGKHDREDNGVADVVATKHMRADSSQTHIFKQDDEDLLNQWDSCSNFSKECTSFEDPLSPFGMIPMLSSALQHIRDTMETLKGLKDELANMLLEKQMMYDDWIEEFGAFEALERLRMLLPGPKHQKIVRLWTDIRNLQTVGINCGGQCFEDIRQSFPRVLHNDWTIHDGSTDSLHDSLSWFTPETYHPVDISTVLDHPRARRRLIDKLANYWLRDQSMTVTQAFELVERQTIKDVEMLNESLKWSLFFKREKQLLMQQRRGAALKVDPLPRYDDMPDIAEWSGKVWVGEPPEGREVIWQWTEWPRQADMSLVGAKKRAPTEAIELIVRW